MAIHDQTNSVATDAKLFSEIVDLFPVRSPDSNCLSLGVFNFRKARSLAARWVRVAVVNPSTFLRHVQIIVCVATQEDMSRPHARRIIAAMKHVLIRRDVAKHHRVDKAMRSVVLILEVNFSVAALVVATGILPAFTKVLNAHDRTNTRRYVILKLYRKRRSEKIGDSHVSLLNRLMLSRAVGSFIAV